MWGRKVGEGKVWAVLCVQWHAMLFVCVWWLNGRYGLWRGGGGQGV